MSKNKNSKPAIKEDPREIFRQARVYEIFGSIFALAGFGLFIALYIRNIEGRLFEAIANPSTLLMIVLPFLPAVILVNKAKSLHKKALLLLEKKQ